MKNSQEWFSIAELLERKIDSLPTSDKGIVKKAAREGWEKRQREGVKGKTFEYNIYTMPQAVQIALGINIANNKDLSKLENLDNSNLQQRIDLLEQKLQALEAKTAQPVAVKPDYLTDDEWRLVCAFRRCNVDRQLIALSAVEALADQTDKELTSSYTATEDNVA